MNSLRDDSSALPNGAGWPSGVSEVAPETTAHDAAERAVRASETKLEAALACMTDAVSISDLQGNFIDFNDSFATFHKFKNRAECANTLVEYPAFLEVFHNDGTAVPLEQWAVARALRGETVTNEEYELRRRDTGESWVGSYSFGPIRNEQGEIVGSVVVARDITENKCTEAALLASEERFRAVVDGAPDAIFIQTCGLFAYVNKATQHLFGAASPHELLGKPVIDHFHPDSRDQISARIRRLNVDRETVGAADDVVLTLAGEARDVNVSAVPFLYNNQPGALVFARDITARKAADVEREQVRSQLRQAQKMESVGRLAGGIAHDFNNLLSVILNYVNFAMEDMPTDCPQRDLLEVKAAAERAAALTRQLLAFSRKQVLKPELLSVNEVTRSLANMLQRIIGEDIKLTLALSDDEAAVKMDRGQLEQVLMNLATNARDAMPLGGELRIETGNVDFRGDRSDATGSVCPGPYVLLSVTDSGFGMDKSTCEHIFDPFFTTKPVGKGTGLGLSTVFGIVEQSGGCISVDSEPRCGARFKLYFPKSTDHVAASIKHDPRRTALTGTETVLIVEDEAGVRKMVKRILVAAGYTVHVAANGNEAVRWCEQHPGEIHLLLTDVVMPDMNGRQLAERVTALSPKLKVLFMSGYTGDAIVHHGVLDPGSDFVAKPFKAVELQHKIREVLDK
jgi:two-component system, cell cycle sensor histidine kinase and response regulator CckA